ncbi:MAG: rod shape-determining protein [Christensenellales bacterium]|jgi:rod shape-determining protein MreB
MAYRFVGRDLGIDLGTANTLVYMAGRGIVLREPSVVAVSADARREILAVGEKAKLMIGRTPGNITAVSPLRDGVIADFDATEAMLRYFIKKALSQHRTLGFISPRVVICVPCGVTDVERRAVEDAARRGGARDPYIMEEPLAAAIGAGLPVKKAMGSMVVDIGGGTSEVAIVSLSGIVSYRSLRVGGNALDEQIVEFLRKEYNLAVGEQTAEDIKLEIGTAYPRERQDLMQVRGRDLTSGLPKTQTIASDDVLEAISGPLTRILEAICRTLEECPPELARDIVAQGICLTGGGALLPGLDRLITRQTGIRAFAADSPLDCVVVGAGKMVENAQWMRERPSMGRR